MPESTAGVYDAFISYNHTDDAERAKSIHGGIERLGKPWYQRRALRAFLDTADLRANPDLWESVEASLLRSRALIVICSPGAARSIWVEREIERWLTLGRSDSLYCVLSSGRWQWPPDGRVDDHAVPPALNGLEGEPNYVDLSDIKSSELDLGHERFRMAMARLVAALREVELSEVEGRVVRERRRLRNTVAAVLATLVALLIGLSVAVVVALSNQRTAEENARVAKSQALAAESANASPLDAGLQLATEAYSIAPTVEAEEALFEQLTRQMSLETFLHPQAEGQRMLNGKYVELSADETHLYVVGSIANLVDEFDLDEIPETDVDVLVVYDLQTGQPILETPIDDVVTGLFAMPDGLAALLELARGSYVIVDHEGRREPGPHGEGFLARTGGLWISNGCVVDGATTPAIEIMDTTTGTQVAEFGCAVGEYPSLGDHQKLLLTTRPDGGRTIVDLETLTEQLVVYGTPTPLAARVGFMARTAGGAVALGWDDGSISVHDPLQDDGAAIVMQLATLDGDAPNGVTAVAAHDRALVAVGNNSVSKFDLGSGELVWAVPNQFYDHNIHIDPVSGNVVVVGIEGVLILDGANGSTLAADKGVGFQPLSFGIVSRQAGAGFAVDESGRHLAVVGNGVALWDVSSGVRLGTTGEAYDYESVVFSGSKLLAFGNRQDYWQVQDGDFRPGGFGRQGFRADDVAIDSAGEMAYIVGTDSSVSVLRLSFSFPMAVEDRSPDGAQGARWDPVTQTVVQQRLGELERWSVDGSIDDSYSLANQSDTVLHGVLPNSRILVVSDGRLLHRTLVEPPDETASSCSSDISYVVQSADLEIYAVRVQGLGIKVDVCRADGILLRSFDIAELSDPFFTAGLALSPDGQHVAVGSAEGVVQVYDVDNGEPVSVFEPDVSENPGQVNAVTFTPDGNGIVVAVEAGTLYFWDLVSSQLVSQVNNAVFNIWSMAINPEGLSNCDVNLRRDRNLGHRGGSLHRLSRGARWESGSRCGVHQRRLADRRSRRRRGSGCS